LMPSSNDQNVHFRRDILVASIMPGFPSDVEKIIVPEIFRRKGHAMSGLLFPNNLTRLTKSQKDAENPTRKRAYDDMDAPPGMSACTSTYVPRPYISAPLKPPLRPIVVQASLLLLPIILQSLSTSIVTIDAKVNSLTKEPLLTASQMNDILTALGDVVDGQKLLEEVKKKQYKEIWKLKRKVKILVKT
ncbi:hypothetical protein HAX54_021875, partial [Datura stramonium]|nr:hypothetical protein [Datura stramonium]